MIFLPMQKKVAFAPADESNSSTSIVASSKVRNNFFSPVLTRKVIEGNNPDNKFTRKASFK
jgi:hypothetical protein